MKKPMFLVSIILFFTLLNLSVYASDIELIINDFKCEYDEAIIRYRVKNYISHERKNVSVIFKINREDRVIACEEKILTIPKNADDSGIYEIILGVPCDEGKINLEAELFHEEIDSSKQKEMEPFISNCPEPNK